MTTLKFDPRHFFVALAQVKLACSKDDFTPALTLISARAEGTSLHLAATDRYRAHYAHVELDDSVKPVNFTLSSSAVADLKSMRWNAKRGGPIGGEAIIAGDGMTFSAIDGPEIRYPLPDAQEATLDAAHGVVGLLSTSIHQLEQEDADKPSSMAFNPAFMGDIQRAARLAPSTGVSVTAENIGDRFVCRLSDDSTRFRALVMGLRRPPEAEGNPHAEVAEGFDRVQALGVPSTGYVTPPSFRKDGSPEREAAKKAQRGRTRSPRTPDNGIQRR